jgi:hypothetical protein
MCLSRKKIFISSHIAKQRRRVWLFIRMMAAVETQPLIPRERLPIGEMLWEGEFMTAQRVGRTSE